MNLNKKFIAVPAFVLIAAGATLGLSTGVASADPYGGGGYGHGHGGYNQPPVVVNQPCGNVICGALGAGQLGLGLAGQITQWVQMGQAAATPPPPPPCYDVNGNPYWTPGNDPC